MTNFLFLCFYDCTKIAEIIHICRFDQLEQEIQSLGLMGEPEAVNSMLKLERFKYSEDILHAKVCQFY